MAASPSRGRQAPFLVGLLLILAALPVGWFVFLREPPAPLPPPAPPAPVAAPVEAKKLEELILSELSGTVEVRHGDGPWMPASKDMPLRPADSVRTGDGSWAVLVNGDLVEVRLEDGTEVSVAELTDTLSRLLLTQGEATATVRGRADTRHTLEVRTPGGEAEASTTSGVFTMTHNGEGTVKVGTRLGDVKLTGKDGRYVIVRAGQQSIVRKGQAPSEPAAIPADVFLKVAWPTEKPRTRKLLVAGTTEPGSRVTVDGVRVKTDAEGRFSREVELPKDSGTVKVVARGVGGALKEDQKDIKVRGPGILEVNPETLWKSGGGATPSP
jgi:hypothetical protein